MAKYKEKLNIKKELMRAPSYLLLLLWVVFTFAVIGWIILASLSTTREIFSGKLLNSGFHFENYMKALFVNDAIGNLINSVIYTLPACLAIIFVCAPAAYCITRFRFRGGALMQNLIVLGLGIPNIMVIMPLFSLIGNMGLTNSRAVLILLYIGISIPFNTYFLMTFYRSLPSSFEEAASIDGCGSVRTFWSIMFPLSQPAIVTVTIFNFIAIWNEYFVALIFANKQALRPISVGLYATIRSMVVTGDWAGMFASVVIVFLPTVLIYIFMCEKIVAGVTSGGIKA